MKIILLASTTSPGFVALPFGELKHAGAIHTTLTSNFILTIAQKVLTTQAPPPISPFIISIPAEGFSEIPPESKQI